MKRVLYLLCVLCMAGLLSACQTGTEDEGSGGVSETAVSGQTTGEAADTGSEGEAEEPRYCSDTCFYQIPDYEEAEEEGYDLIQVSLKDGSQKKLDVWGDTDFDRDVDISEFLYADSDNLYFWVEAYSDETERASVSIYRIPLKKNEDGTEQPDAGEKEEILGEADNLDSMEDVYMDAGSIYYFEKSTGIVWRYDRAEKTKENLGKPPQGGEDGFRYSQFILRGSAIYLWIDEEGFQCLNEERNGWNPVPRDDIDERFYCEWTEEGFYYAVEDSDFLGKNGVVRCDIKTGKDSQYVSKEELQEVLVKALGASPEELLNWGVIALFEENGRIYISMHVQWEKDGVCQFQTVMVSGERGENPQVVYEKDLTESLLAQGIQKKGTWENHGEEGVSADQVLLQCAQCAEIENGKAYLSLGMENEEKEVVKYGVFQLDTGEFREVNKKDEEYWEPYFSNQNMSDWDKCGGTWWLPETADVKWEKQ